VLDWQSMGGSNIFDLGILLRTTGIVFVLIHHYLEHYIYSDCNFNCKYHCQVHSIDFYFLFGNGLDDLANTAVKILSLQYCCLYQFAFSLFRMCGKV